MATRKERFIAKQEDQPGAMKKEMMAALNDYLAPISVPNAEGPDRKGTVPSHIDDEVLSCEQKTRNEQIAVKVDAILALAEVYAAEAGQHLSEGDQSIITRCVEAAYYAADRRGDGKPPLLGDFYDILKEQPEPEAQIIALRCERYVKGFDPLFERW